MSCLGLPATQPVRHGPLGATFSKCLCFTLPHAPALGKSPACHSSDKKQSPEAWCKSCAETNPTDPPGGSGPAQPWQMLNQHVLPKLGRPWREGGGIERSSSRKAFIQVARTKIDLDMVCARIPYLCQSILLPGSS